MVDDLGEQPTPETEPAEPPPGGVDAVEDEVYGIEPVVPGLASALDPYVAMPEHNAEGIEPTADDASGDPRRND